MEGAGSCVHIGRAPESMFCREEEEEGEGYKGTNIMITIYQLALASFPGPAQLSITRWI